MKKALSILLSLSIIMSVIAVADFSAYALASSGTCGNNVTWSFNSSTGTLTISGSGKMTDYDSFSSPFRSTNVIKKLVINSGVTSVGECTFERCTGLTSISLGSSVTSIGMWAFRYCSGLKSVTIPSNVKTIGSGAFAECTSLSTVNLNKGLQTIGDTAFDECTALTSISIPSSVTSIGSSAFFECAALKSVTIPNGISTIGSSAFSHCTSITSILIPSSVTSIGYSAFSGCTSIKTISVSPDNNYYCEQDGVLYNKTKTEIHTFPPASNRTTYVISNGVTSVCEYAFYGCTKLTSITMPSSTTTIGYGAFYGCVNLSNISIPNGVQKIDSAAFSNCESLTSISIPNSVTSLGSLSTFSGCTNLKSVVLSNSLKTICLGAFARCVSLTSVTIPEGITKITTEAFSNCESLQYVAIPSTVTTINDNAFNKCTKIKYVFYSGSVVDWDKITISDGNTYLTNAKIHYNSTNHTWKVTQLTKAAIGSNGKIKYTCSVCGETKEQTIVCPKTIKLSKKKYTYNGKVKKPAVTVLDANEKAIASSNYTVSYSSGRKNPGKYSVTVSFTGNYTGAKKLTFTIKPKKTSITKAEPMNKAFGIKWKKVSKISGYEVQVSTSKKFKKGVKSYTAKASSESAKVSKNIKGNTTYYIRIRTFKTVKYNGKKIKIYSTWSKVKSVTTKG